MNSSTHSSPIILPLLPPDEGFAASIQKAAAMTVSEKVETKTLQKGLELNPTSNHDGIDDTVTAIVQCSTTAGNLTIDVRGNWAPIGSAHYLNLVETGLFTKSPFIRVCPKYITQFGQGRHTKASKVLMDDPTLWGKRDMNYGYLFYAGSGKNSRSNDMVFALCDSIKR